MRDAGNERRKSCDEVRSRFPMTRIGRATFNPPLLCSLTKARKEHECALCKKRIRKGEAYLNEGNLELTTDEMTLWERFSAALNVRIRIFGSLQASNSARFLKVCLDCLEWE